LESAQLEEALDFVEHTLGSGWLKDSVDQMKDFDPERTTSGRYVDFRQSGVSPVAIMWYVCREQTALYQLTGQLTPSAEALLLVRLVNDIKTLEHIAGFDRLRASLKDASIYDQVAYEIYIASGFVRLGYFISFAKNIGDFNLTEQQLTVKTYKFTQPCDEEKDLETVLINNGEWSSFYYFDYPVKAGESPDEILEAKTRSFEKRPVRGAVGNIVCTTTAICSDSKGYYLQEKSLPLRGGIEEPEIYLPDTIRR